MSNVCVWSICILFTPLIQQYILSSAVSLNSAHGLWAIFKWFSGKELIWKRCHQAHLFTACEEVCVHGAFLLHKHVVSQTAE